MIQIIPVQQVYASLSCDWPGCPERMGLPVRPAAPDRDFVEMRALRLLAEQRGWGLDDDQTTCPNHPREAA